MAASLKGIDPALKNYLRQNKLPEIYEALLTGLAVMCPDNPYQFVIEKLRYVQENGTDTLEWDSFVEEYMKPKIQVVSESNLDFIFNFDDSLMLIPAYWRLFNKLCRDIDEPTAEMYEKAYGHYNDKLKTMCYYAWMQYHLHKKRQQAEMQRKTTLSIVHHRHRIMRVHLYMWTQWVKYRKGRQAVAFNKIQHVFHVAVGRIIFEAWHNVTMDAKKTREYFEINLRRLERGENMDDDDAFGKGNGEARDDISMLPRKVSTMIFNHLDISDLARCARVCRSWKVITQASSLWSQLDLSKVRYRITDKVATRLLSKCRPYLVHLNLRGCMRLTTNTFYSIRECRNLQDLNLSECQALNDDTLKMVAEGCKILLYLNVSHSGITDASLRTLAKNCTNLQYLSLAFCQKFTDRGLHYFAQGKGCRKLVHLDLSGCQQITPEGYRNIAEGCSNVQCIILNELGPALDDDCIEAITQHCKQVRSLSFLGSPNLTDESFKRLANSKKLQSIKIEGNQKITDVSFKHIGKFCHEFKHFYMVDCQQITDMSLKALNMCKNLTVINLADCVRITDTGVRYIVESSCGPKLQEFNLTNCIRVGDMAMVNIHKRCHNLTYLSVCFCEHISEAGIELLGQTHSLIALDISGCNCGDQGVSALGNNPRFRDVSLSECSGLTDLGLQKFAQQCHEVERLDLSYCEQLTDGAIKNLAFCCRMLNVLNLAGCKLLTDLSIQYLSGVCHYLNHLDLSGCVYVTDKSMKYLRKGCRKLKTLIILHCKAISKQAAQKMLRHIETVQFSADDVPSYYNY